MWQQLVRSQASDTDGQTKRNRSTCIYRLAASPLASVKGVGSHENSLKPHQDISKVVLFQK